MNIKHLSLTAMLFALIVVLSVLEAMLPPLPIPGAKLGLANMVVMYSLLMSSKAQATTLVVLKAGFAFFTRGVTAGLLSLCGGVLSLIVAVILISLFKSKLSLIMLCVSSAVFHNVGQFVAAYALMQSLMLMPYFVPLVLFGVAFGICSAILLKLLMPYMKKLHKNFDSNDFRKGVF